MLLILVVLFADCILANNVQADKTESEDSWFEKRQEEKRKCLRAGEKSLKAISTPQEVITLEQIGQHYQLLGHRMSELIPINPQGIQLCKKVSTNFGPYKTEDYLKACREYETATKVVLGRSACSLLEILNEQAVANARVLGEDNGVRKFNLYRKACHLLNIA